MKQQFKKDNHDLSPFYRSLLEGEFDPSRITVVIKKNTLKRSWESEAYISQRWKEFEGKKWPNDTTPSRFRFVDAKIEEGRLVIALDPCVSYKDHIGTRDPDFAKLFGPQFLPAAVSLDSLVITSDKKILLTKRGDDVDYRPSGLHASFGGWVNISDADSRGSVNLTKVILREVQEESAITSEEVRDISCVGIIEALDLPGPGLIFISKTTVSSKEVVSRKHDHENIVFAIPSDGEMVKKWMISYSYAFVPPALAVLLKYGREEFGVNWHKKTRDRLHVRGKRVHNESEFKLQEKEDTELLNKNFKRDHVEN